MTRLLKEEERVWGETGQKKLWAQCPTLMGLATPQSCRYWKPLNQALNWKSVLRPVWPKCQRFCLRSLASLRKTQSFWLLKRSSWIRSTRWKNKWCRNCRDTTGQLVRNEPSERRGWKLSCHCGEIWNWVNRSSASADDILHWYGSSSDDVEGTCTLIGLSILLIV